MKHLILIGSRGTGKSQLARLLEEAIGWPRIDLDEYLEEKNQALQKLIEEKISWEEFRILEEETLEEILLKIHPPRTSQPIILSTGGGTAESEKNRALLKASGRIIYLNCPPEQLDEYLKDRLNQPSYPRSAQEDLLRRHSIYAPLADLEINTHPWEPEKWTAEIIKMIQT